MSNLLFGALGVIAGLVGLFMAARTQEFGIQVFGGFLMVFGILFAWWMIKTAFDEAEGADRPIEGA